MRYLNNPLQGYIAIVASIIVTTIIGVVALVFSSSNFLGRYDTLALEDKEIARVLADGCVEYARLKLALNSSYPGGETVSVASSTCRVVTVTTLGSDKRIATTGVMNGKVTNLAVIVRGSDFAILERREEVSF